MALAPGAPHVRLAASVSAAPLFVICYVPREGSTRVPRTAHAGRPVPDLAAKHERSGEDPPHESGRGGGRDVKMQAIVYGELRPADRGELVEAWIAAQARAALDADEAPEEAGEPS